MKRLKQSLFQTLFSIDLRTLALFRVCLGLTVLYGFYTNIINLRSLYTNEGFLPAKIFYAQIKGLWVSSIFLLNDTVAVTAILFALAVLACLCFIVGWKTRWASFWMWLFVMSVQVRNPYCLIGGDTVMRHLCFMSMFLPLGDKYAWDARPGNGQKMACSFATLGVMMVLFYVYFFTFLFKMRSPVWASGEGVKIALQLAGTGTPAAAFLLRFEPLLVLLNYATLVLEGLGPILFFVPWYTAYFRTAALLGFFALQGGLFTTMSLLAFPFASTAGILPFVPSSWWDFAARFQPMRRAGKFFRSVLTRPAILGPVPEQGRFEMPLRLFLSYAALFFTVFNLWLNLESYDKRFALPKTLDRLSQAIVKNSEGWRMFAFEGGAPKTNVWFVLVGKMEDGSEYDILQNGPVNWECPPQFSKAYRNGRFSIYVQHTQLYGRGKEFTRAFFVKHFCQEWNRTHQGLSRVIRADLYHVRQTIGPKPDPLLKRHIYGLDVPKKIRRGPSGLVSEK